MRDMLRKVAELRTSLSTSRALCDELRRGEAEARAESERRLETWAEARKLLTEARAEIEELRTKLANEVLVDGGNVAFWRSRCTDLKTERDAAQGELSKARSDFAETWHAKLDELSYAQQEREAARRELAEAKKDLEQLYRREADLWRRLRTSDEAGGVTRRELAEERKRRGWSEYDEMKRRAEAAEAQLAEAMAILADNNESCLKREDVAKGLAYCVRQILDRWQGASDEAEMAESRARAAEGVVEAARAPIQRDPTHPAWDPLREALAAYDAGKVTSPDTPKMSKARQP